MGLKAPLLISRQLAEGLLDLVGDRRLEIEREICLRARVIGSPCASASYRLDDRDLR
jgi:hypothetical protein